MLYVNIFDFFKKRTEGINSCIGYLSTSAAVSNDPLCQPGRQTSCLESFRRERCFSPLSRSLATIFPNRIGFSLCCLPRYQTIRLSELSFFPSLSHPEAYLSTVVWFLFNFLIGSHCSLFYVFSLQYFTATFRLPEPWAQEQATEVHP